MPQQPKPYYLAELVQKGGVFLLRCSRCRHRNYLPAYVIAQTHGAAHRIKQLRFICSKCGDRRPLQRLFIPWTFDNNQEVQ